MTNPSIYRRPAFPNRPWITGALYDKYANKSVMHVDAYTYTLHGIPYLSVEYREGGKRLVALDTWLIETDGLTSVWDVQRALGVPVYWTRHNAAVMARIHARVVMLPAAILALGAGRWTATTLQAHYVHVRETDAEPTPNHYTGRKAYKPRIKSNTLPDIL